MNGAFRRALEKLMSFRVENHKLSVRELVEVD
jgi:hypothetical protein